MSNRILLSTTLFVAACGPNTSDKASLPTDTQVTDQSSAVQRPVESTTRSSGRSPAFSADEENALRTEL